MNRHWKFNKELIIISIITFPFVIKLTTKNSNDEIMDF